MATEAEKAAQEVNNGIAELKSKIEAGATKEELATSVDELKSTLENKVSKEDFNTLKTELNKALEEVETLKENGNMKVKKTLTQEIKENKESLVKAVKNGGKEVTLKALTQRSSVTNSPSGFMLPDIGQLGVKERSLYNVLPKITISDSNTHGNVRYRDWDEATTIRSAAMVAEGAAFPESTAKWDWYVIPLRKIGDTLPVTEEFFEDEAQAASELNRFLDINVNLVVDDQLINGDNTGQNLNGFLNVTPAYTAVASGVTDPNLKDLVIKMRNDITRSRGSKYRPDMVLVSSSTMETLVLAKDGNNNYIFDENTGTLAGLTVVVDENMPDNQLIVGDRRFATVYQKDGVSISQGLKGDQFIEDEMTLKARKRMLFLVRTVDQTGFRKSVDVTADLVTIGTAV